MATARLQKILFILGIAIIALAILWWGLVSYFVAQQTGGNMLDGLSCIFSVSASCNFMRGMAWMRGMVGLYEPVVFWLGLVVLGIAIALKRSIARDQAAHL